jgi:hypothetical protein
MTFAAIVLFRPAPVSGRRLLDRELCPRASW